LGGPDPLQLIQFTPIMMETKIRTVIRIAGSAQYIRSREAWGNNDRVQTTIGINGGMKTFASQGAAERWIARYYASILPAVWNHLTLGEAAEQGLLEVEAA